MKEYTVNQSRKRGNKLYAIQITEGPAKTKKSNNNISINKYYFMWITTLIRASKILSTVVFGLFFLAHYLCLPLYSGFSTTKLPFHPSRLGFQEGSEDSNLIKRLQLPGLISVMQRVRIEQGLVIAMSSSIAHLL